MGDTVSLPKRLDDLDKEAQVIEEKSKKAKENKGDQAAIAALDEQIKALRASIAKALIEDAKREIKDAADEAKAIAQGKPPKVAVPPGPDQKAIAESEEELERVKAKLAKAAEYGATPAQQHALDGQIAAMKKAIRDAALAAAKRELKEAKQKADDIKNGKGPPPPPNGNGPGQQPDPPQGGGGGGGGSGSGGANGGSDGSGTAAGKTASSKEPDPLRVFVKSERTVWAWSRRDQAWISHRFNSKLIDVKMISGGILAIAEHEAMIFDTLFGRWLTDLTTGNDTLVGGDAS